MRPIASPADAASSKIAAMNDRAIAFIAAWCSSVVIESITERVDVLVVAFRACPCEPVACDLAASPSIEIALDPVIVDVEAFGAQILFFRFGR